MTAPLDILVQLANGIATEFGTSCEIVIHDLTKNDVENSIVYIENGHITNRQTDSGSSAIVLETLELMESKKPIPKDQLGYLTRTSDGRILKSSTLYIKNKDQTHVDYIFSVNYDITAFLNVENALRTLVTPSDYSDDQPKKITHNVNELLDSLIEQSIEEVGKPVAYMTKDDKIAAIKYLNNAGAFLITKSGDKVSTIFGISKFTLYSYLDIAKQEVE